MDFILKILPNVASHPERFFNGFVETLIMTLWSGGISFVIGLLFGITLTVTKKDGILQNSVIYQILDKAINLFRSIPFIILLTGVMPLSRLIMGTAIGVRGAIVPLIFGCVPFFSRQVETALAEVDSGLVEAAESMGLSPFEIIFRVKLFTFLEFVLESSKCIDVAKSCLLDVRVNLLDRLLSVICLSSSLLSLHFSISLEV